MGVWAILSTQLVGKSVGEEGRLSQQLTQQQLRPVTPKAKQVSRVHRSRTNNYLRLSTCVPHQTIDTLKPSLLRKQLERFIVAPTGPSHPQCFLLHRFKLLRYEGGTLRFSSTIHLLLTILIKVKRFQVKYISKIANLLWLIQMVSKPPRVLVLL